MRPGSLALRALPTLCLVAAAACSAEPPDVLTPPDQTQRTTSAFADVVLGISIGDSVVACSDQGGVPVCGQAAQTGACAGNPALGPKDGVAYDLGPGDRIELGLLCSFILETGGVGASDDFKIWGRVEGGAQPVVEVSTDATHYFAVNFWPPGAGGNGTYRDDPGFQLEVPQLPQARFVRVSEVAGQGHIRIDAVEAFPIGGPR